MEGGNSRTVKRTKKTNIASFRAPIRVEYVIQPATWIFDPIILQCEPTCKFCCISRDRNVELSKVEGLPERKLLAVGRQGGSFRVRHAIVSEPFREADDEVGEGRLSGVKDLHKTNRS